MDHTQDDSTQRAVYRIRSGTLDAIAHKWNAKAPQDLAALLRLSSRDLTAVRQGALIGLPMAIHIADLMGSTDLSVWTVLVRASPG